MDRDRPRIDRDLRDLLTYLRDTFRDAATRIDDYIVRADGPAPRDRDRRGWNERGPAPRGDFRDAPPPRNDYRDAPRGNDPRDAGPRGNDPRDAGPRNDPRDAGPRNDYRDAPRGNDAREGAGEAHEPLERLREEVRRISHEAPDMEPALLRLHVEAVTAETRQLQSRAADVNDQETAARIMRALTAIVSEHRPGHVYGLARHHQADWEEMSRRARDEIRGMGHPEGSAVAGEPQPGNAPDSEG